MKCKAKIICMVLVLAMAVSTTVFATVGTRTAELLYDNIKIMLNGKEIVPTDANGNAVEPFIIDGTTYLPVRGVASALGMNVGWDDGTKTVALDNPGVFQGGVQVYDDKYVTIEFAGCTAEKRYEWSDVEYHANFNVKNKTDAELTFQSDALSFDGISYKVYSGSDEVAPQSTGKISFQMEDVVPTSGISKTSGKIKVVDFDRLLTDWKSYSYDAKWVNVTQE